MLMHKRRKIFFNRSYLIVIGVIIIGGLILIFSSIALRAKIFHSSKASGTIFNLYHRLSYSTATPTPLKNEEICYEFNNSSRCASQCSKKYPGYRCRAKGKEPYALYCCPPDISPSATVPTVTATPTLTPIPTVTATPTLTPTPTIDLLSTTAVKYKKYFNDKKISGLAGNGAILKLLSQKPNETIPQNMINDLDQMLNKDISDPNLKNYVFNVKNDQYNYKRAYDYGSGITGTDYYIYYYVKCGSKYKYMACFMPDQCPEECYNNRYFVIRLTKDQTQWQERFKEKPRFEWKTDGYTTTPPEDRFPSNYGVNGNNEIYTLAADKYSKTSTLKEELVNLKDGKKVFFTIPFVGQGLLLSEVFKEANNIIFKGIFLSEY